MGIILEFTAEQNGVVERAFATVRNRGYAMMLDVNFSKEAQGLLWCEAMDAATGLANITAMTSKDICTHEGFYGVKPLIYNNLQPFGRVRYITKHTKIPKKFTEKSTKCICLSNAMNHVADVYRAYDTETKVQGSRVMSSGWIGTEVIHLLTKLRKSKCQQWLD